MPAKMQGIVLTDAEREEHIRKYPLPGWCKKRKISKSKLFILSPEWKELRQKAIGFYGSICMCCQSVDKVQVDHIKPKSKYPELALDFDNLQILCWNCNKKKSNIDETDYRNSNYKLKHG